MHKTQLILSDNEVKSMSISSGITAIELDTESMGYSSTVRKLVRAACTLAGKSELAEDMAGLLTLLDPDPSLSALADKLKVPEFATCTVCNQEMAEGNGCFSNEGQYFNDGSRHPSIPYGEEEESPCHDCNVLPGQYHHPGCDMELCARCGGQRISCDCVEIN